MIRDFIEGVWFFIIMSTDKRIRELNSPYLEMRCKCIGKLILVNKTNRGQHFFCLRCFTKWIKPFRGNFYKERDFVRKAERHPL